MQLPPSLQIPPATDSRGSSGGAADYKTLQGIQRSPAWFLPCPVLPMMNQFPFQHAEEALNAGVVPTVSSRRHAPGHARGAQVLLVGCGGILTAAI